MTKRATRVAPPATYVRGPWAWFGNTKNEEIQLATVAGGRKFVMTFRRWGMSSAQPCFYADGLRRDIGEFVVYEQDYRDDILDIDHPDARLIAHAPEILDALVEVLNLRGDPDSEEYAPNEGGRLACRTAAECCERAKALVAKVVGVAGGSR